jgi:hypothetical protein
MLTKLIIYQTISLPSYGLTYLHIDLPTYVYICIYTHISSQSYITTDNLSVLVSGTHLRPATNFSHSPLDYFFWQCRVCWCGAPSLARSRVCSFQFLPGIASAVYLRSESHGTHEHILLSIFLRPPPPPQPGGPGSCIYFPQEQGSPVIPSSIGFV